METLEQAKTFTLEPGAKSTVLKTPDGRVVFEYVTHKPENTRLTANSACFLHPVNTPQGERVTDLAPGDHRHHRGIFLAWHAMEFRETADFSALGPTAPTRGWNIHRADFWGWGQFAPTAGHVIRNQSISFVESNGNGAQIEIRNAWQAEDHTYMAETTTVSISECDSAYILDFAIQLVPRAELILDQTSFSGFCVRARNDGPSRYVTRAGNVNLADPHYSIPALNWPAADWYDYTIQLPDGNTTGVAVIDHPANPPATWHNARYLSMLNPCVLAGGPLTLARDEPLQLRYRVVTHDGPTPADLLNGLSHEWQNDR